MVLIHGRHCGSRKTVEDGSPEKEIRGGEKGENRDIYGSKIITIGPSGAFYTHGQAFGSHSGDWCERFRLAVALVTQCRGGRTICDS